MTESVNENMDAAGFSNVSNETLGVYPPGAQMVGARECVGVRVNWTGEGAKEGESTEVEVDAEEAGLDAKLEVEEVEEWGEWVGMLEVEGDDVGRGGSSELERRAGELMGEAALGVDGREGCFIAERSGWDGRGRETWLSYILCVAVIVQ